MMRFRSLGLFVVLTACASTQTQTPGTSTAPMASMPSSETPAVQPAPPVVAAPAATPAPSAPMPVTAYGSFNDWKQDFIKKAVMRGFDSGFVAAALQEVQPLQSVKSADNQQPEFSKPASSYIRQSVAVSRARAARARIDANANVPAIEARYGVPKCLLGGIWTMESDLGRVQGSTDVIAALATLAFDGRRRVWAEDQLIAALTILRDHKIPREKLKGSWAGAMGQTQFMPDNYLRLAVDGDNDGVVDIWGSDSDALASAANLLSKAGWKTNQEWAVEVILPADFDYYLAETEKTKKPADWQAMGVKRADGGYFRPEELNENAVLLLPSGAKGPAFLALPNHFVIRKYNNSTSYALAVGLNADAICGKETTATSWPVEPPLSLDQRMKTQAALKAAGFDPGVIDGVIGVGTRQALREWQRANNEPADGYLSFELANRFVVMQGGTPALRPAT